ncbi:muconate/chloromuconate family cycloisomerase [Dyella flava]|uniref:Muconate cycloisomerase n=1 Tax=Dyella flava TaxID=1920170 RepID=A0ABS2K2Z8_9GAMM|nr:muconate/chloromuconate family cycloisomerase [Dyella flava]MBM7125284.1 muconate cycloisomerase [Dyella flava]GLQ50670.1 muconate cycloisomerase [Dyella flava]
MNDTSHNLTTSSASRIERVETLLLDIPTIRPHRLSVATMHGQLLMLVRVYTADGIVGLGEGTTIGGLAYGPESPEGMKLTVDRYIAPQLVGADSDRVQALMDHLGKLVKGNNFVKCAIETALLDARAKRIGVPLSELLGGRRRDTLPVAWTLASGDTGRDIEEAEHMLEMRRHNIFKLKIGLRTVDADVAHVAAIKRALGSRGSVRVDVNMAWSETEAIRGMAGLVDAGCELVEQPVKSAFTLARLVRRFPIALMADESVHGPDSAFELARAAAADAFTVKIEQSGGLFAGGQVAAIADAAGIELYGGTMLEGAIGTIAAAQLFSTFRQLQWGTELFGPLLLTEEILTEPLRYENFQLHLPNGPGLGIALDEERVNSLRRDRD